MGVETRQLSIDSADDWAGLLSLAESVGFGGMHEKLRSNWMDSSPHNLLFGAHQDGVLVACALYISHDIRMGGVAARAFQACWTMVRPEHQGGPGLGVIYRKAFREFVRGGVRFFFGFPKDSTVSVYTGLRIVEVNVLPMRRTYMVLGLPRALLEWQWDSVRCEQLQSRSGLVSFDQASILAWKQQEHSGLVSLQDDGNFLWGKVVTRRVPVLGSVKVLLVGGYEISNPAEFMRLAARMRTEHGVGVIRFVSPVGSVVAGAGRLGRAAPLTESFMYAMLMKEPPGEVAFDVCTGIKDVF